MPPTDPSVASVHMKQLPKTLATEVVDQSFSSTLHRMVYIFRGFVRQLQHLWIRTAMEFLVRELVKLYTCVNYLFFTSPLSPPSPLVLSVNSGCYLTRISPFLYRMTTCITYDPIPCGQNKTRNGEKTSTVSYVNPFSRKDIPEASTFNTYVFC